MKDYVILKEIVLGPQHSSTDHTHHHRDGQLLPSAAKLQIAQYKSEPGFYLIYLDKNGKEMTDTYHDSLEKAFKQTEFEYQVKPEEWKDAEFKEKK